MAILDRRSGNERRAVTRYIVNIDVEWESSTGRNNGTISDLSLTGCFVMCSGDVSDGEKVRILLPIGDGMKVEFRGEIVNHVYEIGFAAKFVEVTESQHNFLQKLINNAKNNSI